MRTNRVRRKSKMRSKDRRNKVNHKIKKRTQKRTKRTRKRKIRDKRMRGGSSENSNEEVIGYLFKKGQLNKSFQERYFKVITNSAGDKSITYSNNENSKKVKGIIPLNSVLFTSVYSVPTSDRQVLTITTNDNDEAAAKARKALQQEEERLKKAKEAVRQLEAKVRQLEAKVRQLEAGAAGWDVFKASGREWVFEGPEEVINKLLEATSLNPND